VTTESRFGALRMMPFERGGARAKAATKAFRARFRAIHNGLTKPYPRISARAGLKTYGAGGRLQKVARFTGPGLGRLQPIDVSAAVTVREGQGKLPWLVGSLPC
jgi:hypothetical protein